MFKRGARLQAVKRLRQFFCKQIDPKLAHGVAVSRRRFFLAFGNDLFAPGGVVFEAFEAFEQPGGRMNLEIIDAIGAFGRAGTVRAGEERNSGEPGVVEFRGGLVQVAGF